MTNTEELIHMGIKGMRWGHRNGKKSDGSWLKETAKMQTNATFHPILTNKANIQSKRAEKSFGTKLRRTFVYQSAKDLKDVNDRTDKLVKDSRSPEARGERARKLAIGATISGIILGAAGNVAIGRYAEKRGASYVQRFLITAGSGMLIGNTVNRVATAIYDKGNPGKRDPNATSLIDVLKKPKK